MNTEGDTGAAITPIRQHRLVSLRTARLDFFGGEISDSMLRKLIRQKAFPSVRIGRRVLLSEADLAAYVDRQRTSSAAERAVGAAGR